MDDPHSTQTGSDKQTPSAAAPDAASQAHKDAGQALSREAHPQRVEASGHKTTTHIVHRTHEVAHTRLTDASAGQHAAALHPLHAEAAQELSRPRQAAAKPNAEAVHRAVAPLATVVATAPEMGQRQIVPTRSGVAERVALAPHAEAAAQRAAAPASGDTAAQRAAATAPGDAAAHPALVAHPAARAHQVSPMDGGQASRRYWEKEESKYYAVGKVLVLEGDSNRSIAKRMLELRGSSTAGADPIPDEVDRIAELNKKYPEFNKEWSRSHRFVPGQVLDVTEPRIGPDIHTAWKDWQQAKPGAVNYVSNGERMVAVSGSTVVVEPGGAAMLQANSKGFGAKNTYIETQPGSVVVSAGHVSAFEGSKVIPVSGTDVTLANRSALDPSRPRLFPS